MSWTVQVVGKPSEIVGRFERGTAAATGMRPALRSSQVHVLAGAVAGMLDTDSNAESTLERTVVVKSSGHADAYSASVTFTIETFNAWERKEQASAE